MRHGAWGIREVSAISRIWYHPWFANIILQEKGSVKNATRGLLKFTSCTNLKNWLSGLFHKRWIFLWGGRMPILERLIDNDARCQFKPIVSGEAKNVIFMQVPRIRCCGQTPPPAKSMELYQPASGQNGMSREGICRWWEPIPNPWCILRRSCKPP